MAAYAVVERVPTVPPRLGHAAVRWEPGMDLVAVTGDGVARGSSDPVREADSGAETLADRVARLRIALAQTTWYLFNPEGWR